MSTETARSINLEKREQNYTESDMKRNCETENAIKEIHLGFLNIFRVCEVCMCVACARRRKALRLIWFFFSVVGFFFLFYFIFIFFGWDSLRLVSLEIYIRNSFRLSMCECFNVWLLANRFRGPFECVIFHLFCVSSTHFRCGISIVGLLYLCTRTHIRIEIRIPIRMPSQFANSAMCMEKQRITSKEPPKGWERDAFFFSTPNK